MKLDAEDVSKQLEDKIRNAYGHVPLDREGALYYLGYLAGLRRYRKNTNTPFPNEPLWVMGKEDAEGDLAN